MSILFASLSNVFQKKPIASASAAAGDGDDLKWTSIPNAQQALLQEVQQLYWNGVRRELTDIIFTLKRWQHEDFEKVALSDENDQEIIRFDTFLDQVNESSRDFALEYCEHYVFVPFCSIANPSVNLAREKARAMNQTSRGEYAPRDITLQNIARQFRANQQSKALKKEIKEALEARLESTMSGSVGPECSFCQLAG